MSRGRPLNELRARLREAGFAYGSAIARSLPITADEAIGSLKAAACRCGLSDELGADAVQEVIVASLQAGERKARDERAGDNDPSAARAIVRCAAEIEPEHISWLWPLRIALGKIALLAGLPGVGKSQLMSWMAATITTGERWPEGGQAPEGSVIMIGCEDDASDTMVPRLQAVGADLQRVHILDWAVDPKSGQRRHFDVHGHIEQLAALVRRIGDVRLIVIDPITAYMGRADTHVTADVRGALAPLQSMASDLGVAVLLISHLNKTGDGSAMARVTGSGAFVALSRSAWLAGYDPDDEARQRRIFAPIRCSLAANPPSLAYIVEPVVLPSGIVTSRIVIDPGPVAITADELVRAASMPASARSELDEAKGFITAELEDGPKETKAIERAAKQAGISKRTLERAREALGVVARKDGAGGSWRLRLPTTG
nr:AAA family ATPase [Hyphomicrobium sp. NDB2Meth4]